MLAPKLGASGVMFKVAKGCGHNRYGEPAWPNEIFYVFPVVICGVSAPSIALGGGHSFLEALPSLFSRPFLAQRLNRHSQYDAAFWRAFLALRLLWSLCFTFNGQQGSNSHSKEQMQ